MVAPITPIGAAGIAGVGRAQPTAPTPTGFGDALARGLQAVSNLEHQADAVTQSVATGGGAKVEDLMVAVTKAQLGIETLAQVRDRAVEAYQEIMRMPL